MPSQMLTADMETAVANLIKAGLGGGSGVDVDSIGERDINEEGQLVFRPPCVRTRYAGGNYGPPKENTHTVYDYAPQIEIFCVDEDLRSSQAQREASKRLLDRVKPILAGARIVLSDDGKNSEPIILRKDFPLPQDIVGMVYILVVEVPGIAQFPGTFAGVSGSED